MPQLLAQCCCGCSLRTGVKLIGVVEDCLGTVGVIVALMNAKLYMGDDVQPGMMYINNALYGAFITLAVCSFISILFTIILHVGIKKELPILLKAWIYSAILTRILLFIFGVILIWAYVEVGLGNQGIIYIILVLIIIGLTVYFMMVVNSLKKEFEEKGNKPQQSASNTEGSGRV